MRVSTYAPLFGAAFLTAILCVPSVFSAVTLPNAVNELGQPVVVAPVIPVDPSGNYSITAQAFSKAPVVTNATGAPVAAKPVILVDPSGNFAPGVLTHPARLSGRWYPAGIGSVKTGIATGVGSMKAYPFWLDTQTSITDLGARVGINDPGAFQLAVYGADTTTLWPAGLPLATTGDISTAVVGMFGGPVSGGAKVLPGQKLYWAVVNTNSAIAAFMARDPSNNSDGPFLVGSTVINDLMGSGQLANFFLSSPEAYNSWPNASGETWTPYFTAAQAAVIYKVQ